MKELSRRTFIKEAAASAATLTIGSLLAGCAANETPKTDDNSGGNQRTWDKETDVLILGAGGAGMCAGYEATQAGAKALILEKAESFGGTSIRSGGIIQASGTAAQKKLTSYQEDTAEKHAQYYLGRCYENGTGVTRDLVQAAQWYQKAARQGQRDAQFALAACYENGWGIKRSSFLAAHWRTKARNNNDV